MEHARIPSYALRTLQALVHSCAGDRIVPACASHFFPARVGERAGVQARSTRRGHADAGHAGLGPGGGCRDGQGRSERPERAADVLVGLQRGCAARSRRADGNGRAFLGHVLGIVFAGSFPSEWGLGFAGVLALVGLCCTLLRDVSSAVSATAAFVVTLAARGLPLRLNIVVAICVSMAVGVLCDRAAELRAEAVRT